MSGDRLNCRYYRMPSEAQVRLMSKALGVKPEAFADCKGRSYLESIHLLFHIEEDHGIEPVKEEAAIKARSSRSDFPVMENVIYNELRARGYSVDVGVVEKRAKVDGRDERQRLEVDFVANLGYRRYYIQSALRMDDDEKREQEKRSLRDIGDSFRKIVVVRDVMRPYMDDDGILTMGLFDFLLDPRSLDM